VTQKEHVSSSNGWNVGENEARLARARQAFDQGLREASEKGARAARRMIVPVLWGGALIGGALLAMAMLRLARRQAPGPALLRVYVQPPEKPASSLFAASSLLPALGGALARMAVQHFLKPAPELLPPDAANAAAQAPLTSGTAPGQPNTGNDRDRS